MAVMTIIRREASRRLCRKGTTGLSELGKIEDSELRSTVG